METKERGGEREEDVGEEFAGVKTERGCVGKGGIGGEMGREIKRHGERGAVTRDEERDSGVGPRQREGRGVMGIEGRER